MLIAIEQARRLCTLRAPQNNNRGDCKKQSQCWDTAWSSDSRLFAWSCGRRQVKIVRTEDFDNYEALEKCIKIDCWQIVMALEFADLSRHRDSIQVPTDTHNYRILQWEEHSQVLAIGMRNGRIRLIDVNTGSILLELLDHTDHVSHLQFIPDSTLTLASASYDGTIKLWDLADDGNMRASIKPTDHLSCRGEVHKVFCISSSPDTLRLASVGTFKTVVIFNMQTLKVAQKLVGHANHVNCCQFGPDGVLLITASVDTSAIIWNSYTGQIFAKLGHQYPPPPEWFPGENDTEVLQCAFTRSGLGAATVASDGYVRFWDLTNELEEPSTVYEVADPLCCSFNMSGSKLAIGTTSGDVEMVKNTCKTLSLAKLCRTVVNNIKDINYFAINDMMIPSSLKEFLRYEYVDL
ncbi:WD repeat and SOCS box-containing protein 1-like isoform X2 [Watersipora subatra]|uniref:WD repeat and SOCS box-containing protein 1-like isoform X2 n=1 Tax=Watersipora subatra TaxID=2589382 RepID=UPI00355C6ADB